MIVSGILITNGLHFWLEKGWENISDEIWLNSKHPNSGLHFTDQTLHKIQTCPQKSKNLAKLLINYYTTL